MFGMAKSTELTIIVIFGGIGSVSGSVLGSILLTALPEILRTFAIWRLVVYGAAVIFIMISRPEGLMGGKEITLDAIRRFLCGRKAQTGAGAGTGAAAGAEGGEVGP
jgi:branched-chain amino acid transport system permease protein